jgi:hypothetical protein
VRTHANFKVIRLVQLGTVDVTHVRDDNRYRDCVLATLTNLIRGALMGAAEVIVNPAALDRAVRDNGQRRLE